MEPDPFINPIFVVDNAVPEPCPNNIVPADKYTVLIVLPLALPNPSVDAVKLLPLPTMYCNVFVEREFVLVFVATSADVYAFVVDTVVPCAVLNDNHAVDKFVVLIERDASVFIVPDETMADCVLRILPVNVL